jgi:hypothetical protein
VHSRWCWSCLPQVGLPFLTVLAWWSLVNCSPILHNGKNLFKHVFTYPWSQYRWQGLSIWYLLDSILNLRFDSINSCINSSFSIMMVSWRYTWELTQSYFSRHTWYMLNFLKTNLWITPWITPWSSHNLLHCLLLTTLNPTCGSSIVYGQVLHI